jgi:aspartate oxidase
MKRILLVTALLLAFNATAQTKRTIECGESNGFRFDVDRGKVTTESDKSRRRFFVVFDRASPKIISILWPESKASNGLTLPSYTKELLIASSSSNQITGLDIDPTGDMVGLYSFFPKEDVVYFTQHRYQTFSGGSPNSTSFWAKCTF